MEIAAHFANTGAPGEENALVGLKHLVQEVPVAYGVHCRHDHLEEGRLFVVAEHRYNLLPKIHSTRVRVHVATPQIARVGHLRERENSGRWESIPHMS